MSFHIQLYAKILFIFKSLDHLKVIKTAQKQGFGTLNFNDDKAPLDKQRTRYTHSFIHSFTRYTLNIDSPFCPNAERGPVYSSRHSTSHFAHDHKLNLKKSLIHNNLIFNNHTCGLH